MIRLCQIVPKKDDICFLSISILIRMAPPRPLGTPPMEGNHELDEWNYLVVTFLNEGSSRIG